MVTHVEQPGPARQPAPLPLGRALDNAPITALHARFWLLGAAAGVVILEAIPHLLPGE